jgi:hypothetical protein
MYTDVFDIFRYVPKKYSIIRFIFNVCSTQYFLGTLLDMDA